MEEDGDVKVMMVMEISCGEGGGYGPNYRERREEEECILTK